ncbi:MAG: peptidylprolyl isomerase [Caryophanon sp.]|nr:peptidylprolyl isomerase [Caryophanon sp.]
MKFKKIFRYVALPTALAAMLAGCSGDKVENEVLATVGDTEIFYTDLADQLIELQGKDTLETMITNEIVKQEADKAKVKVSDEDIDAEYENYINYYGGEESFNSMLQMYGMSADDVRKDIENSLLTEKVIASTIEVKDDELKKYFDENAANYETSAEVAAKHILVETEEDAKKVQERLNAGEEWDKLAAEMSTDTSNKDKGGDLGFFGEGVMVEAFQTAAFAQEVGTISEPVQTDYGFHIINVYDKKEATPAVFEDVKDKVKDDYVYAKVSEQYATWMEEKKEEYKVENKLAKESDDKADDKDADTDAEAETEDADKADDAAATEEEGTEEEK